MISTDNLIKKRILITGANTLSGQRLINFFALQNRYQVLATSLNPEKLTDDAEYIHCDITSRDQFKKYAMEFYPDVIINAEELCNSDKYESEKEKAWKINVKAIEYITEVARVLDSHVIHLSSIDVFGGSKGPYSEKAVPNPLTYYARTRLAAENVLKLSGTIYTLVRASQIYGLDKINDDSFIKRIVKTSLTGEQVSCDNKVTLNPLFTDDLVQAVSKIIEYKKQGIFHIGGKDFITMFELAERIINVLNLKNTVIKPVLSNKEKTNSDNFDNSLVTIKAQTELRYEPHSMAEALLIIKKELNK